MPVYKIFALLIGTFLQLIFARAQVYDFDPVVVTASRIPTALSSSTRSLSVLTQELIVSSGAQSITELLAATNGVDIRARSPYGVQSDVSIRGADYEQTLILLDGVKLSDPQTGHHNLDLPIDLNNVEQIEILRGSGAKLFGPNAFGGVINIITKKNLKPNAQLHIAAGQHVLFDGSAALSLPVKNSTNQLSFTKNQSKGYRFNTDFDQSNLFYKSTLKSGIGDLSFSGGYTLKDFGANDFYAANYPNQREDTKTLFLNTDAFMQPEWGWFSGKLNWRRHKDHYLLDYTQPVFYENFHTTDVFQAEIQATINRRAMTHNVGIEVGQDNISSNNLGSHRRLRSGLFYENQIVTHSPLLVSGGAAAYYYSDWGWSCWPGIDLGYQLSRRLRWAASIGRSFRVPTFTELYYQSPANLGNSQLKPESAWNFEQNLFWTSTTMRISASLFWRKGKNLIDWVRLTSNDPWQARNIARIQTAGIETELNANLGNSALHRFLQGISISYSYLRHQKSTASFESKYLLNSLRNQLILKISPNDFCGIKQYWTVRYEDRLNQDRQTIVDVHLSRAFKKVTLSLSVTNLGNIRYADYTGIPQPGRWITGGMDFSLPFLKGQ
jgi:vitamin B12 transporter